MTNSPCVALELQRKCPNRTGHAYHRHVRLEGGRTKAAQIYPDGLCRAICKGLMNQIEFDQQGRFLLAKLQGIDKEMTEVKQQLAEEFQIVETEDSETMEVAWDDVTGAELDPAQVKRARLDEVKYIRNMKLHSKVDKNECWMETGKSPIKVRWIDINKGVTRSLTTDLDWWRRRLTPTKGTTYLPLHPHLRQ